MVTADEFRMLAEARERASYKHWLAEVLKAAADIHKDGEYRLRIPKRKSRPVPELG